MHKPFIHLFHTPNSWYLYDVNTSEIINISEAAYSYLQEVITSDNSVELALPQELVDLQSKGYLASESRVCEVQHPYSNYLEIFLQRKLTKITLQLTQNCNFRCKYCIYSEVGHKQQRIHSSKHMSWETAKKAVDFLWEHSVDSRTVNIGFYGGEPLLEFPLLQHIVEYSEKLFRGKKLTFALTTNGSLLSDEIILYFAQHEVELMISLDGPKEVNDTNRVFINGLGTYDTVVKRINRIREIAPEYADKLSINMVIDPQNSFNCIMCDCKCDCHPNPPEAWDFDFGWEYDYMAVYKGKKL